MLSGEGKRVRRRRAGKVQKVGQRSEGGNQAGS